MVGASEWVGARVRTGIALSNLERGLPMLTKLKVLDYFTLLYLFIYADPMQTQEYTRFECGGL